MSKSNNLLDAALAHASRGWPVFPCSPSNKIPMISKEEGGQGYKDATTDEATIRKWWKRWPNAMIGVPTGAASGIFVVDQDRKPGGSDGVATWTALHQANRRRESAFTRIHTTPSTSRHALYKWRDNIRNIPLDVLGPGIEIKGEGGYIIVPPSRMADGKEYTANEVEEASEAPSWLLAILKEYFDRKEQAKKLDPPTDQEPDIELIKAALNVIPSDDYETWFAIGGALRRAIGENGYALFEGWSQKSPKFKQADCRYKWTNGLASVKEFGLGTIFWYADKAKPDWRPQRTIIIRATPYVHVEASLLPRRRWEYKPSYIRQFTSMVVATSKVGKSSLLIAEALACVSHKALLGVMPSAPLRVWYWNGEDPRDEIQRHVSAAMKYYDLTPDDIGDRLFVDSGRTMPIVIAEMERFGTRIAVPVVNGVIATIRENSIDALIIDPFVSSHHVNENDNIAIERVAKQWAHIAEETNCCVRYAHHSRKTGGEAVTGESQRGASSNYAAVRSVDTLNYMTEREAEDAGIEVGQRKYFFRQDYDSNLLPPAEVTTWYEKVSVDLLNAPHPEDSDKIGVVVPWSYPQTTKADATPEQLERILTAIKEGGPWRRNIQTWKTDWVGIPVARVLGIDIVNSRAERKRVGRIVEGLIVKGDLRVSQGTGSTRGRPSPFVTVNPL